MALSAAFVLITQELSAMYSKGFQNSSSGNFHELDQDAATLIWWLWSFPIATVMNGHKFSGFRLCKCVLWQFWKLEVQNQFHCTRCWLGWLSLDVLGEARAFPDFLSSWGPLSSSRASGFFLHLPPLHHLWFHHHITCSVVYSPSASSYQDTHDYMLGLQIIQDNCPNSKCLTKSHLSLLSYRVIFTNYKD